MLTATSIVVVTFSPLKILSVFTVKESDVIMFTLEYDEYTQQYTCIL